MTKGQELTKGGLITSLGGRDNKAEWSATTCHWSRLQVCEALLIPFFMIPSISQQATFRRQIQFQPYIILCFDDCGFHFIYMSVARGINDFAIQPTRLERRHSVFLQILHLTQFRSFYRKVLPNLLNKFSYFACMKGLACIDLFLGDGNSHFLFSRHSVLKYRNWCLLDVEKQKLKNE